MMKIWAALVVGLCCVVASVSYADSIWNYLRPSIALSGQPVFAVTVPSSGNHIKMTVKFYAQPNCTGLARIWTAVSECVPSGFLSPTTYSIDGSSAYALDANAQVTNGVGADSILCMQVVDDATNGSVSADAQVVCSAASGLCAPSPSAGAITLQSNGICS